MFLVGGGGVHTHRKGWTQKKHPTRNIGSSFDSSSSSTWYHVLVLHRKSLMIMRGVRKYSVLIDNVTICVQNFLCIWTPTYQKYPINIRKLVKLHKVNHVSVHQGTAMRRGLESNLINNVPVEVSIFGVQTFLWWGSRVRPANSPNKTRWTNKNVIGLTVSRIRYPSWMDWYIFFSP